VPGEHGGSNDDQAKGMKEHGAILWGQRRWPAEYRALGGDGCQACRMVSGRLSIPGRDPWFAAM
jgi:hypothetical protein